MVPGDVVDALADGLTIVHVVEAVAETKLKSYAKRPRMKKHKVANIGAALELAGEWDPRTAGVVTVDDVVDRNEVLCLGFLSTLVNLKAEEAAAVGAGSEAAGWADALGRASSA